MRLNAIGLTLFVAFFGLHSQVAWADCFGALARMAKMDVVHERAIEQFKKFKDGDQLVLDIRIDPIELTTFLADLHDVDLSRSGEHPYFLSDASFKLMESSGTSQRFLLGVTQSKTLENILFKIADFHSRSVSPGFIFLGYLVHSRSGVAVP